MRLCHVIRTLPPGNGGFPRWAWRFPLHVSYRCFLLCNVIVPRFQFCLWIDLW